MKTSLLQQIHPSNWEEHPPSSIWMIVDWDGNYFNEIGDSFLLGQKVAVYTYRRVYLQA